MNDDEVSFKVKGSAEDPYDVRFVHRSDGNFSAYCSCQAGQNGMHCKHRLRILDGKSIDIVSGNIEDVKLVTTWVVGTDVELAIQQVILLEDESKRIKKELSAAKKKLGKCLLD